MGLVSGRDGTYQLYCNYNLYEDVDAFDKLEYRNYEISTCIVIGLSTLLCNAEVSNF